MAAFGAGTLPVLASLGVLAAHGVGALRGRTARRLAGAMVVAFGMWTFAAAATASLPFGGATPHCHAGAARVE